MKLLAFLAVFGVVALGAVPQLGGVPTIDFSCSKPNDLLTGQKVIINPPFPALLRGTTGEIAGRAIFLIHRMTGFPCFVLGADGFAPK